MKQYILSHDLGTSGNKAALFHTDGDLIASMLYEYPTYYPAPGQVEQNPEDWWQAVCRTTKGLLEKEKINKKDVAAVSFSAQMMGCLPIGRDGKPLRNMMIWADTRAVKQEAEMERLIGTQRVYRITGHRISASYTAAKLLWIRENEPHIYRNIYKVIHAKDYITYRLTGNIMSDYSDASGTNLFDIRSKKWSEEILEVLQIPLAIMPSVYPSSHIAGTINEQAAGKIGLSAGTPVVIGGGDGSCACVGAGVIREGNAYNVLGTSSWISVASKEPVFDEKLRTFNWIHLDGKLYTPCGTMQAAGYSYQWYKNTFCGTEAEEAKRRGISTYEVMNEGAGKSVPGANKLLYLPYLLGERSPRWNNEARGAFVGMNITTTKMDMSRAVLEGVGYNLKIILKALEQKVDIPEIIMIGGGAKGRLWLQILSDIWQKELILPMYPEEATSMGAAVCAGVGIGLYKDFSAVKLFTRSEKRIYPDRSNNEMYQNMYELFERTYYSLLPVYKGIAELP